MIRLEEMLGSDRVLTAFEERYCYSQDTSWYYVVPDAVIRSHMTEKVTEVDKMANEERSSSRLGHRYEPY